MKNNELRLGNYLENNNLLCVVIGLSDFGAKQFRYVDGPEIFNDTHKNLEAITITEEWLLKLDFSWSTQFSCYMKDTPLDCPFFLDKNFIMMDIDLTIEIEYIHQLQNIYHSLTGEELTLK